MNKFRTSFSGYNKEDVNAFVNEVIQEYESILQKLRNSTKEMECLNKELERYKGLERTLNDTLLVAQETSANAHKAAIAEGKLIIEEAKNNASRIINNSRSSIFLERYYCNKHYKINNYVLKRISVNTA